MRKALLLITGVMILLAGCANLTPEQAAHKAIYQQAAEECQKKYSREILEISNVSPDGQLWYQWLQMMPVSGIEKDDFLRCYQQRSLELMSPQRSTPDATASQIVVSPRSDPSTVTTISVRVLGKTVFVPARLNGEHEALLLLDTGASFSLFRPSFLKTSGISIPKDAPQKAVVVMGGKKITMQTVQVLSITVGDVVVPALKVGVYDGFPKNLFVDGVFGTDFLLYF